MPDTLYDSQLSKRLEASTLLQRIRTRMQNTEFNNDETVHLVEALSENIKATFKEMDEEINSLRDARDTLFHIIQRMALEEES